MTRADLVLELEALRIRHKHLLEYMQCTEYMVLPYEDQLLREAQNRAMKQYLRVLERLVEKMPDDSQNPEQSQSPS
jgi:hypothetical protein